MHGTAIRNFTANNHITVYGTRNQAHRCATIAPMTRSTFHNCKAHKHMTHVISAKQKHTNHVGIMRVSSQIHADIKQAS